MLSAYRGNSQATTPQASNKAIAVSLSGALPASGVFATPVTVTFALSPYSIVSATSGTTPPERTFLANTAGGAVEIDLPGTPIAGEIVNIKRKTTDGNTLTIGRNAKSIEGSAANLTNTSASLDSYTLQYDGSSSWWII